MAKYGKAAVEVVTRDGAHGVLIKIDGAEAFLQPAKASELAEAIQAAVGDVSDLRYDDKLAAAKAALLEQIRKRPLWGAPEKKIERNALRALLQDGSVVNRAGVYHAKEDASPSPSSPT